MIHIVGVKMTIWRMKDIKKVKVYGSFLAFALFYLSLISSVYAFNASSLSYTVKSFHTGIAGDNASTTTYDLRFTLTYQQGSAHLESLTFQGSSGWFQDAVAPSCGNNVTDFGEQCDGSSLGGQTCIGLGYTGGSLSCTITCSFDTSSCTITGGVGGGPGGGSSSIGNVPEQVGEVSEEVPREEPQLPAQLFDIKLEIEDSLIQSSDELSSRITFESFGRDPTAINLLFIILDENGGEVHREGGYLIVETEEVLIKKFENLNLDTGKYSLVLKIKYYTNITDEFEQNFEIKREEIRVGLIPGVESIHIVISLLVLIAIAYVIKRVRERIRREKTIEENKLVLLGEKNE